MRTEGPIPGRGAGTVYVATRPRDGAHSLDGEEACVELTGQPEEVRCQLLQTGVSAQDPSGLVSRCIPPTVCRSSMLRHGRPSPWANTESSRITVAECFACRTWITASPPFLTASAHQLRGECTSTQSISSSPGTAPSLGWPSAASSSCVIACIWNRGTWPPTPSTNSLQPCDAWLTKPPMPVC